MNRKADTTVGKDSSTFGTQLIANTDSLMVNGRYNIAESNYMLQETMKTSNGNKNNAFGYKIESFEIDDSKGTFICINKSTMKTYATAELNALYFNDSFAGPNVTLPQRVYKPIEKTYNGLDILGSESYTIKYIEYTIVQNDYTHAHIVGNGTSDTERSNAHTLDWEGNAWYSGDVYVGSTSGTNRDEGSKKLATVEEVQELASQISSQSYVAQTEAPEDKNLLWVDLDDESDDEGLADAIQAAIADVKNVAIPVPDVAEVGQTVVVKEVDGNGKPVAWEAVNLPSGGTVSPEQIDNAVNSYLEKNPVSCGGGIWSKVAEFTYNQNIELTVDSYNAENKHLHFITEHGLTVGDYLLINDPGIIKTSSIGYTIVTTVVDAQTVMCDSITNTSDFSGKAYKVEKSGGRILFKYDGLITKPYARLKIEGKTIFQNNENWTFSTYWGSYGGDLLLGEVKDSISVYRSIVNIVPATHVGKKEGTRLYYNAGGYAIGTPSESVVITYNTNYSPIPHKQVATPKLVFNGLKITVEEADTWELL